MTNGIMKSAGNMLRNHIKNSVKSNSYNAKSVLASAVLIDTTGNLLDTYNLSHNKNIPEDEGKYLAAYKISNAIVSCFTEIGVGFLTINKKVQGKLEDLVLGNMKNIDTKTYIKCQKGLVVASSVFIATILLKRLVVPFLVTPLASIFKQKFLKDKKENIELNHSNPFAMGLSKQELGLRGSNKLAFNHVFDSFNRVGF